MNPSRIRQQFAEHIEHTMLAAEHLPDALLNAGDRLLAALLEGGRVFVFGDGHHAWLAQLFSARLLQGHSTERPPLPALALSTTDTEAQLRALCQRHDMLVMIGDGPLAASLASIARDRDAGLVLLSPEPPAGFATGDNDCLVPVPSSSPSRWQEITLLALHTLCDHIEQQLFGDLT